MTMIANLRHAAHNRQTVSIGGGDFGRAELLEAAKRLEQHAELVSALQRVTHPMADDTDVDHALELLARVAA